MQPEIGIAHGAGGQKEGEGQEKTTGGNNKRSRDRIAFPGAIRRGERGRQLDSSHSSALFSCFCSADRWHDGSRRKSSRGFPGSKLAMVGSLVGLIGFLEENGQQFMASPVLGIQMQGAV